MGIVGLQKVRSNRVMLVIDKHHDKFFHEEVMANIKEAIDGYMESLRERKIALPQVGEREVAV